MPGCWLLKFKAYLQYCKDKKADSEKAALNIVKKNNNKKTLTIVKLVQREAYAEEIQDWKTRGHVKRWSKSKKL